jgi:hypothetical protein
MTLEDAVTEVLARIGQLDDGVANPLLAAEAVYHINAAQRKLIVEHGLATQRRRSLITVAGGQRYVDLPADARQGQIRSAVWVQDETRIPLVCGVPDAAREDPGDPAWYDLTPSVGITAVAISAAGTGYSDGNATVSGGTRLADGHDPTVALVTAAGVVTGATITNSGSQWTEAPTLTPLGGGSSAVLAVMLGNVLLLELGPAPDDAGTLEIEYQAGVVKLVDDGDLLALDPEAVIGRAATLLAITKGLPSKQDIERDFVAYMQSFRTQQSPGRSFSLVPQGAYVGGRQDLPRLDARRA